MIRHLRRPAAPPDRVVVLGATGFIGASLCRVLANEGVAVLAHGSRSLNLSDREAAEGLAGQLRPSDSIVFAAALTRERGADVATLMRNLTMAEAVIAALEQGPCAHLVYLSSDAVYGDAATSPVTAATACEPSDLYGVMHLTRERMLADAAGRLGCPLLVIRPCGVYGANDTHNGYGPNRFARTLRAERRIQLIGMGEELRDHIHVDDVARLIQLALWSRSTGVLNAATGMALRFAEVAELLRRAAGDGVTIEWTPRHRAVAHRFFDVAEVRQAFPGFVPRTLDTGLVDLVPAPTA